MRVEHLALRCNVCERIRQVMAQDGEDGYEFDTEATPTTCCEEDMTFIPVRLIKEPRLLIKVCDAMAEDKGLGVVNIEALHIHMLEHLKQPVLAMPLAQGLYSFLREQG